MTQPVQHRRQRIGLRPIVNFAPLSANAVLDGTCPTIGVVAARGYCSGSQQPCGYYGWSDIGRIEPGRVADVLGTGRERNLNSERRLSREDWRCILSIRGR